MQLHRACTRVALGMRRITADAYPDAYPSGYHLAAHLLTGTHYADGGIQNWYGRLCHDKVATKLGTRKGYILG